MIYCNYDDNGARKLKIMSMVHTKNVMVNIEIQRCYYVYYNNMYIQINTKEF